MSVEDELKRIVLKSVGRGPSDEEVAEALRKLPAMPGMVGQKAPTRRAIGNVDGKALEIEEFPPGLGLNVAGPFLTMAIAGARKIIFLHPFYCQEWWVAVQGWQLLLDAAKRIRSAPRVCGKCLGVDTVFAGSVCGQKHHLAQPEAGAAPQSSCLADGCAEVEGPCDHLDETEKWLRAVAAMEEVYPKAPPPPPAGLAVVPEPSPMPPPSPIILGSR